MWHADPCTWKLVYLVFGLGAGLLQVREGMNCGYYKVQTMGLCAQLHLPAKACQMQSSSTTTLNEKPLAYYMLSKKFHHCCFAKEVYVITTTNHWWQWSTRM